MNDDAASISQVWLPVIARSLALLSLDAAKLEDNRLVTKAKFLENLGLERKEAAAMLGTTYASLTEMLRLEKKKGSRKTRNGNKKSRK